MNFYVLLLLYTFLYIVYTINNAKTLDYNKIQLHNELNRELRNYLCCANKMKCCRKRTGPPAVEIRAVLTRCPNIGCEGGTAPRRFCKPLYDMREGDLRQFQGFDDDEFLSQSDITNCNKKLILTLKTSSDRFHHNHFEYIVIDHAYDPVTKKQQRLFTPYVIKFKQEPVMQMYGMKFLHIVNAHAQEEVINKHTSNYTGCYTTSSKPTCGRITYKGKVVPYSEGFCCSCDTLKNIKRQPESPGDYGADIISYSDPAFLLDGIECPKNLKGAANVKNNEEETPDPIYQSIVPEIIENVKSKSGHNYTRLLKKSNMFHNHMHNNYRRGLNDFSKDGYMKKASQFIYYTKGPYQENISNKAHIIKRQVQASGAQRRGGQNCADRYTPKGVDPETYHESAHCLRFSDLWYTVYRLQSPVIEHSIIFQVFEKHEDMNGHTFWKDVTRGKRIKVGTTIRNYLDEKNTISVKYSSKRIEVDPNSFALDYRTALFLVPEGIQNVDARNHPEIAAGPSEYLIVHSSQISLDGDQCNVAGVGFEAFAKQPNRCGRPKGTCLLNQPYHLWKHDHQAEELGKKGCFFLKFYGKLPADPIRKHVKTDQQFLVLEYPETYTSTADFEIKADFNTLLRPQSSAIITEVYVDSTSPTKTIITVKITNSGLVSSSFMARLSDCPLEMPASFNNIESQPVLIPPQHQHIFHLKIKCILPADRFHCSVEALNYKRELVAIRRIRIQKFDRCICTWHCLCACLGSLEGLKCVPMSLQQHHAAGFQGSLPVTTHMIKYTFMDEVLLFFMYIFLFLILILLMLGLGKALIGIFCSPVIGTLGLDIILDLPKPIRRYYESELMDRHVVYDREGWPIHPDTDARVRSVARSTEFCMNLIFFFAYPVNVFILIIKKLCCAPDTYERRKDSRSESMESGSNNSTCFEFLRNKLSKTQSKEQSTSYSASGSSTRGEMVSCTCTKTENLENIMESILDHGNSNTTLSAKTGFSEDSLAASSSDETYAK